MLLQLFYLCLENGYFVTLRFCVLDNIFEALVKNFIFVSLSLNILPELFVVHSSICIAFILNHFCLLNKHIHHDINLFPNLVRLLLKQL